MREQAACTDLRIADLPEDLRPEGERLKAEYHALAQSAGLVNADGALDPRRLDDLTFVTDADPVVLTQLLAVGDSLRDLTDPLLHEFVEMQRELRDQVPLHEFRSPAFGAEAASHNYTRTQWAGVRTLERQSNRMVRAAWCIPQSAELLRYAGSSLDLHFDAITVLPAGLEINASLDLRGCESLTALPPRLRVFGALQLGGSAVEYLPPDLDVGGCLDLRECAGLRVLPPGLRVGSLMLNHCEQLTMLPPGLSVNDYVSASGCTALAELPQGLVVPWDLDLSGCTALRALPEGLSVGMDLDLSYCSRLETLPTNLTVSNDLDLRGCSSLATLSMGLRVGGTVFVAGCPEEVRWQAEALRSMGRIGKVV